MVSPIRLNRRQQQQQQQEHEDYYNNTVSSTSTTVDNNENSNSNNKTFSGGDLSFTYKTNTGTGIIDENNTATTDSNLYYILDHSYNNNNNNLNCSPARSNNNNSNNATIKTVLSASPVNKRQNKRQHQQSSVTPLREQRKQQQLIVATTTTTTTTILPTNLQHVDDENAETTTIVVSPPQKEQHQENHDDIIPSYLIVSPQRPLTNSNSRQLHQQQQEQDHEQDVRSNNNNNHNTEQRSSRYFLSPSTGGGGLDDLDVDAFGADDDFDDNDEMQELIQQLTDTRNLSDQRQQRVYELEGKIADALAEKEDLTVAVETLRSELRSARDCLSEQAELMTTASFNTPQRSIEEFKKQQQELSPASRRRNEHMQREAIRQWVQQLGMSGQLKSMMMMPASSASAKHQNGEDDSTSADKHLLFSPRSQNNQAQQTEEYEDGLKLFDSSVSMKTFCETGCGDDNENDDVCSSASAFAQLQRAIEEDESQQISGTFLLPPGKNSYKSKTKSRMTTTSSLNRFDDADGNRKGGKFNWKKYAKFSTGYNAGKKRFSFAAFLFDFLKF